MGQAIIESLTASNPFDRVVGIDTESPTILGPVHYIAADDAKVDLGDLLVMNQVKVLLFLGLLEPDLRIKRAVSRVTRILTAAHEAAIERVVIPCPNWMTVVQPHGAGPDASDETVSLDLGDATRGQTIEAVITDWRARAPELEIVTVRLCAVLHCQASSRFAALLEHRYLYALNRAPPAVHFIDLKDAAKQLTDVVALPKGKGALELAGHEPLTLEAVAGILEKRMLTIPPWILRPVINLLSRFRVLRFDFSDIVLLNSSRTMSGGRLGALDTRRQLSSRQALAKWRAERMNLVIEGDQ